MTAFNRLKNLCDRQGISINTLEEKIDLGKNTLYSWKKKIPTGANLIKVADYFDVSTDYLLGRTDQKRYDLNENTKSEADKKLQDMLNGLDEEDIELLITSLENSIELAKRLASKKSSSN